MIDSRRRWFGLFFLLLALGMLIWGQTWLTPHLQGGGYVAYWMTCLLFTLAALVTASLDARATRREMRRHQIEMMEKVLRGSVKGPGSSSGEDGGR
jgi:hypothetical protein